MNKNGVNLTDENAFKRFNKEKIQSILIYQYQQAISLLKKKQYQLGSQNLKLIIKRISQIQCSTQIKDQKLQQLYFSCLVSIAQIQMLNNHIEISIQLLYQVAKVKDQFNIWIKLAHLCQKGKFYDQAQFILKKAYRAAPYIWKEKVLQKLNKVYQKQHKSQKIKDLSNLIKNPYLIKQTIQQQKDHKNKKISDINEINSKSISKSKRQKPVNRQFFQDFDGVIREYYKIDYSSYIVKKKESLNSFEDLNIKLYNNRGQHKWEFIISLIYILLKCKLKKDFLNKKYLKEYQKGLNSFIQKIDKSYTTIKLEFLDQDNQYTSDQQKQDQQLENNLQQSKINMNSSHKQGKQQKDIINERAEGQIFNINDLKKIVRVFMKYQSIKKKKNKTGISITHENSLLLTQLNFGKKNSSINYRTNYYNLGSYIKEICQKNNFSTQNINKLKDLFRNQSTQSIDVQQSGIQKNKSFQEIFHKVFDQILIDSQKIQNQALNNKRQQQKKQLQKIQHKKQKQKQSDALLSDITKLFMEDSFLEVFINNNEHQNLNRKSNIQTFKNIFQLSCFILKNIFNSKYQNEQLIKYNNLYNYPIIRSNIFFQNQLIKKLLKKILLNMIQFSDNYLLSLIQMKQQQQNQIDSFKLSSLLSILIDKIDDISQKCYKQKQYKQTRLQKINFIKEFIIQNLQQNVHLLVQQVSSKQYQYINYNQSSNKKIINQLKNTLAILYNYVKFYSTFQTFSQEEINTYSKLYNYYLNIFIKIISKKDHYYQQFHLKKCVEQSQLKQYQKRQKQQNQKNISDLKIPFNEFNFKNEIDQRIKKSKQHINIHDSKEKSLLNSELSNDQIYFEQLFKQQNNSESLKTIQNLIRVLLKQQSKQMNFNLFIRCQIELLSIFFKKVKLQKPVIVGNKRCQFNSRTILPWVQFIKLQQVLQNAQKITIQIIRQSQLKSISKLENVQEFNLKILNILQALFLHIKLFIMNPFEEKSLASLSCFRIIVSLINFYQQLCPSKKANEKCVYIALFLDSLIQTRSKNQKQIYLNIRRKFYQHFLSKNYKNLYSCSILQQDQVIKEKILIMFQISYYDKQKQFIPKKMEDSLGFFIYLSKAHSKSFQCKVIDLTFQVNKIFRKCYRIFSEKCRQYFPYCEKFQDFYYMFMERISKIKLSKQSFFQEDEEEFIQICRGNKSICQCCDYKSSDRFLLDILYVIGKYFETQYNPLLSQEDGKRKNDSKAMKDSKQGDLEKLIQDNIDQKLFLQLLLLDLSNSSYWQNLVRINCRKAYEYFDHFTLPVGNEIMINDQHPYRNSFKQTKKLANFIKSFMDQQIKNSIENIHVLNLTKLMQRKYEMIVSQCLFQWNKTIQLQEKYLEGLDLVQKSFNILDVRLRYLKLVEIKFQKILNKVKSVQTYFNQSQNQINKILQQLKECVQGQIVFLCKSFKSQQIHSVYNVKHLQQDLIIQLYTLILEIFQILLTRLIFFYDGESDLLVQKTINIINQIIKLTYSESLQSVLSDKYRLRKNNIQKQEDNPITKNQQKSLKIPIINTNVIKTLQKQDLKKLLPLQYNKEKSYILQFFNNNLNYISLKTHKTLSQIFEIDIYLEKINKILQRTPLLQTTRYKFRRSVIKSVIWASRIQIFYNRDYKNAHLKIKGYYNLKTDDIVFVYHHYQRLSTEKNQLLSQYYNRSLTYIIKKMDFLIYLIKLFNIGDFQNFLSLLKKILRISTTLPINDQQKQIKVIKPYYFVFLYGLGVLLLNLQKIIQKQKIQEKYGKLLHEWEIKIKNMNQTLSKVDFSRDWKKMQVFKRLESFIDKYEQKFDIKIRGKKKKVIVNENEKIVSFQIKKYQQEQLIQGQKQQIKKYYMDVSRLNLGQRQQLLKLRLMEHQKKINQIKKQNKYKWNQYI